jgi:hypothetical protein
MRDIAPGRFLPLAPPEYGSFVGNKGKVTTYMKVCVADQSTFHTTLIALSPLAHDLACNPDFKV